MNHSAEMHFAGVDHLLMSLGLPRPLRWEIHGPTDPQLGSYGDKPVVWVESDRCILTAVFPDPTLNYTLMFSMKTYNKFLEEPDERTD